jgi:hypothetical protein
MVDASRIENLSSQAIAYMRLRLSVEKTFSNDEGFEKLGDIDKMIAHMRSRLNSAFKQPLKEVVDHRFMNGINQKRNCRFRLCG